MKVEGGSRKWSRTKWYQPGTPAATSPPRWIQAYGWERHRLGYRPSSSDLAHAAQGARAVDGVVQAARSFKRRRAVQKKADALPTSDMCPSHVIFFNDLQHLRPFRAAQHVDPSIASMNQ